MNFGSYTNITLNFILKNRMLLRKPFLLFLFVGLAFPLSAQEFYFKNLTKREGLAANANLFVFKDSKKMVWISSLEGVNRFDGNSVKIYRHLQNDSTSLMDHNALSQFIEDSNGDLWFSVLGGLVRYNRKSDDFTNFYLPNEFKVSYLSCIDRDGMLWVLIDNHQVYNFHPAESKWTFKFKIKKGYYRMAMNHPQDLSDGKLFFYGPWEAGVLIYNLDGSEYLVDDEKDILNRCTFSDFNFLNNNVVLAAGGSCGVIKLDLNNNKVQEVNSGASKVIGIELLSDGTYLVLKNSPPYFHKLDLAESKLFPIPQSSSVSDNYKLDGKLWFSYLDSDEVLWLSKSNIEGVSFSKVTPSVFVKPNFEILGDGAKGIFEQDENKKILIDSRLNSYKLNSIKKNITKSVHLDTALPYFSSVFSDSNNKIWAFGADRIFTFENSTTSQYELDFKPLYAECLANNKILISTFEGGIYEMAPLNGYSIKEVNTIPSDDSFPFLYENNDGVLLAHNSNINIDIFNVEENFKKENSIPFMGLIFDCYEELDGDIWLATDKGLAKIDSKLETIELPDSENKYPEFFVKSIVGNEGENGLELWLSSELGITKYLVNGSTSISYGEMDGVPSFDFYPRSKLKDKNGRIWFGGKNGIIHFHPDSIVNDEALPEILINNLLINDEPDDNIICQETNATSISELTSIVLPKEKNTVTFQFNAIDYVDPERTKLKYWLHGHDKDWVELPVGESGFARYANLKAGDYTFKIAGANRRGEWNPNTKEVVLKVLPHFTETLRFRMFVLFIILALSYLFYQWRLKQLLKDEKLRTKAAENKMEALRSQMNPHFIFNSLNSINSYILSNNIKPASVYVGKFAKLMRMILENSKQSAITLESEIEMLKLYADVERLRFKDPFDFVVNLEDNVDDFGTEVPPMMLQPFIENSIWHGLANKKDGKGEITLNISEEGSNLKCIIEDNGIGREASGLIKRQKGRSHQSRALEITKERLSILNNGKENEFSIVFEDLKNDNGQSTGTRATIIIPLNI